MSLTARGSSVTSLLRPSWVEWAPVVLGLVVMYAPLYAHLANEVWQRDEGAHGPLLVGVLCWIVWRKRELLARPAADLRVNSGIGVFLLGLLLYVVGHSQSILTFEIGSQILVAAGLLLILKGRTVARAFLVPSLFFLFFVPPPQFIFDILTSPLRLLVSSVVESVLYAAGYPIARTGVILSVGPYELLVAEACSGLNSMYSLLALSILYLYLMQYSSLLRNAIIFFSVVPIAILGNMVRVLMLVLITYHFGDEAGQGFMHTASGMVVFVVALVALLGFDTLLGRALFRTAPGQPRSRS